jgi:hypothetical protein
MRHGFGGHPYGPNEAIVCERRVGDHFPLEEKAVIAPVSAHCHGVRVELAWLLPTVEAV